MASAMRPPPREDMLRRMRSSEGSSKRSANTARPPQPRTLPASELLRLPAVMKQETSGAINALSMSPDSTRIVVAGRDVLKIYGVEEDHMDELLNFRTGKMNLNYCSVDVAWHPMEAFSNVVATAATNGKVVLWDANADNSQKQGLVLEEHTRTVNRVAFHPRDGSMLVSGSQDGTMKGWDIRTGKSVYTLTGRAESVRDVQFNPHTPDLLAAGFETGILQIWDLRKLAAVEKMTAHHGPIFSVDWHPHEATVLASAGRDKIIKVWDTSTATRPTSTNSVQTIASVARVKWRPGYPNQIASCALLVDFNIHLWDLERPHIPYYTFDQHRDVVTGFLWRSDPNYANAEHYLLSSSKDTTLVLRSVSRGGYRPIDKTSTVSIGWNNRGDISFACSPRAWGDESAGQLGPSKSMQIRRSTKTDAAVGSGTVAKRSVVRVAVPTLYGDPATLASLVAPGFAIPGSPVDTRDVFVWLATKYRLHGASVDELCEHNANIAREAMQYQIAQTWLFVRLFLRPLDTENGDSESDSGLPSSAASTEGSFSRFESETNGDGDNTLNNSGHFQGGPGARDARGSAGYAHAGLNLDERGGQFRRGNGRGDYFGGESSAMEKGMYDDGVADDGASDVLRGVDDIGSSDGQSLLAHSERGIFLDGQLLNDATTPIDDITEDSLFTADNDSLWYSGTDGLRGSPVPDKAADATRKGSVQSVPHQPSNQRGSLVPQQSDASIQSDLQRTVHTISLARQSAHAAPSTRAQQQQPPPKSSLTAAALKAAASRLNPSYAPRLFDATPLVREMLGYYAAQGDVQTCASLILVCGAALKDEASVRLHEAWILSYLDMLHRYELWSVSAEIIKICKTNSINGLSQNSTTVHTACNHCMKPLVHKGWVCDRDRCRKNNKHLHNMSTSCAWRVRVVPELRSRRASRPHGRMVFQAHGVPSRMLPPVHILIATAFHSSELLHELESASGAVYVAVDRLERASCLPDVSVATNFAWTGPAAGLKRESRDSDVNP
eukprot:Opistho-2@53667